MESTVDPPDSPLLRAILLQHESKVLKLRHHLKLIIKSSTQALHDLKNSDKSLDNLNETLSQLSLGSSNSKLLGGIFERELVKVQEEKKKDRLKQIIKLENLLELITGSNERLKQVEVRKKAFENLSSTFYSDVAKFLAHKTTAGSKEAEILDSKQFQRTQLFTTARVDFLGFLEGIIDAEESGLAAWLQSFAGISETATARIIPNRKKSLEDKAMDIGIKMVDFDNLPVVAEDASSISDDDSIGTVPSAPPSASGGSGFSTKSKEEEKARKRSSLPIIPMDGRTRDRLKGFIRNVKDSMQTSPSMQTLPTPFPSSSPPLPPTPTFNLLPPSPHSDRTTITPTKEMKNSLARKKEGFLWSRRRNETDHTQQGDGGGGWHKFWCVLADAELVEFSNWKTTLAVRSAPISLAQAASVRISKNSDRRFCFEILTRDSRYVFQAISQEDCQEWIEAITKSIESILNGTATIRVSKSSVPAQSNLSNGSSNRLPGWLGDPLVYRRASMGSRKKKLKVQEEFTPRSISGPLPLSSSNFSTPAKISGKETSNSHDQIIEERVKTLIGSTPTKEQITEQKIKNSIEIHRLSELKGNSICADCSALDPMWASWSLGIFLCIKCSGIHRSLGTHISKVRSVDLDSWTEEQLDHMRRMGNLKANEIWEFNKPEGMIVDDLTITSFIHSKYVEKKWLKDSKPLPSPIPRPRPFSLPVLSRSTPISDSFRSTIARS